MTTRFGKLALSFAASAAIAVLAPPSARADLEIWLSNTSLPGTEVANAASGSFPGAQYSNANYSGFQINTLSVTSNSTGTPSGSELVSATLDIKNISGATATLYISVGDTGFLSPTAPPSLTVNSHVGGSVVSVGGNNAPNLLTFQSFVNSDDSQNGRTGFSTAAQQPGVTSGSFSSDAFGTITTLGSPYSMTETYVLTLGAGGELNFAANTTLSPVPEPSTMAIAGLGALGMIGYGLRRRKALGA